MKKPITALSNVIELKPGKKYLLVFKGDEQDDTRDIRLISEAIQGLKKSDITCFGFALRKGQDLEVIEAA